MSPSKIAQKPDDGPCKEILSLSASELRKNFKCLVQGYRWCRSVIRTENIASRIALSMEYLERKFTAKYGFLTWVSSDRNFSSREKSIPNIFDTCLIVDILTSCGSPLSKPLHQACEGILLEHKSEENIFSYFHRDFTLIPPDVDTSCAALMALESCGYNHDTVRKMAQNILDQLVVHKDGYIDVFFRTDWLSKGQIDAAENQSIIRKWPVLRRVDIVVTTNLLLLLNRFQVPHLPQMEPSYRLIGDAIDAMLANNSQNSTLLEYAKSYEDWDVILFFISRLVAASDYASVLFREKLAKISVSRLYIDSTNVIHISAKLFVAINSGLLETPDTRGLLLATANKLLDLQHPKKSSYPMEGVYNAHREYFFGSKSLSTAFAICALKTLMDKISTEEKSLVSGEGADNFKKTVL